ncbi:DUF3077 domain-containing protein [Pararhodobacter sp.]|uniref:DUF3077 domain-containing protein n=1 Tax=Pararhodobacter sp. TaxID=2127056 RepID=UPI002AFDE756|nr:DUF3077 domain-containing protein [Pararhodobacter sp.]
MHQYLAAPLPDNQTVSRPFHPCPGSGQPLLMVRAGAPTEAALEHAGNLLDAAYHVARQGADGEAGLMVHALWAVMHLVECANAVIESTIGGPCANDETA